MPTVRLNILTRPREAPVPVLRAAAICLSPGALDDVDDCLETQWLRDSEISENLDIIQGQKLLPPYVVRLSRTASASPLALRLS